MKTEYDRESLIDLIKKQLGEYYSPYKVEMQIDNFLNEGWTMDELGQAVWYTFCYKKNDPAKSNGGIAYINYVREEAKRYMEQLKTDQEKIEQSFPEVLNIETKVVKSNKYKPTFFEQKLKEIGS